MTVHIYDDNQSEQGAEFISERRTSILSARYYSHTGWLSHLSRHRGRHKTTCEFFLLRVQGSCKCCDRFAQISVCTSFEAMYREDRNSRIVRELMHNSAYSHCGHVEGNGSVEWIYFYTAPKLVFKACAQDTRSSTAKPDLFVPEMRTSC